MSNDNQNRKIVEPQSSPSMDANKILYLQSMSYDPNHLQPAVLALMKDLDTANAGHERLRWARTIPGFRAWFEAPNSQVLFINDHRPRDNNFTVSSGIIADLIFLVFNPEKDQVSQFCLKWFCGYFSLDGVDRMTSCLLGQLLSGSTLPMQLPTEKSPDYHATRRLFQQCLEAQLQHNPVFCFIDCIDKYEDDGRKKRLEELLITLCGMAQSCRARYPFKLLVTSMTRCRSIAKLANDMPFTVVEGPGVDLGKLGLKPPPPSAAAAVSVQGPSTGTTTWEDIMLEWSELMKGTFRPNDWL